MGKKFLIRTDGNRELGIGHLKRCLALAAKMSQMGHTPTLVLGYADEAAVNLVKSTKYGYDVLPDHASYENEARLLSTMGLDQVSAVLFDVVHRKTLEQREAFARYVTDLKSMVPVTAMIDGLGDLAIGKDLDGSQFDLIVVPYVGAESTSCHAESNGRYLLGPKYFVFDEHFALSQCFADNHVGNSAERLLLSFGGSDPHNITLKALDAISRIKERQLKIRVVVGPTFGSELTQQILDRTATSRHVCDLIYAPDSLSTHLAWSDLVLGASGLSKYEFSIMGVPAILISIDADHVYANIPFDKVGAASHLGANTDITVSMIQSAVISLLDDPGRRRRMSKYGRSLTDGGGAFRIVSELERVCDIDVSGYPQRSLH